MQTTLLSIAVALILALVTALVGPYFFPWTNYRDAFEVEASRLTGLAVRINGSIDARLLPTPKLTLQDVDIGVPGADGRASLRSVRVALALGSLMRGEIRVADLGVSGLNIAAGLNKSGRLAWSPRPLQVDPDAFSIEHLNIEDGRAELSDAASGSRVVLEKLEFSGDLRSLLGPLKGEGQFYVGSQHYPYRIALSRPGDDGAMKLRATVDPIDRPMAEFDGSLWLAGGAPRFEGTFNVTRGVSLAHDSERSLVSEPWRMTSRAKGDAAGAVFEQVEFQYGAEDHAIRLKGDARLAFGAKPELEGVLSSPQIDLDRVLGLPDENRRKPLVAVKSLAGIFSGGQRLPFPLKVGISADTVTFAGASLQRMSGDFKTDAESWDIQALEFRAPGFTQIRLSGRLSALAGGTSFTGPIRLEANDPRAFVSWLSDRTDNPPATSVAQEPLRLSGDVALGSESISVERLKAELDRVSLEGRLAYRWASADKPAKLDAELRAPELDVDRAMSVASSALGDTAFDWPRAGSLMLTIGHATFAGVEAKNAEAKVWLDASGLTIERLAVGDFGGAALAGSGSIDTTSSVPRGTVTFDFDASRLDGTLAALEKFAPAVADKVRRVAPRGAAAKLHTTLSVDDGPTNVKGADSVARFTLDGRVGNVRVALSGGAGGLGNPFAMGHAAATGTLRVDGKIDSDDGSVVIGLLGLDRVVAVDRRPGQLSFAAKGPLGGDLALDGQLTAGGVDVKGEGTLALAQGIKASLRLDVASADLRPLRPVTAGRPPQPFPGKLKATLVLDDRALTLDQIDGSIAGTGLRGRLALTFGQPVRVDGEVEVDAIDLPGVIAAVAGLPAQSAGAPGATSAWSIEPFTSGAFENANGNITVKSARAVITPKLLASEVSISARFSPSEIAFDKFEGLAAGGRLTGKVTFHHDPNGLTARGRVALADGDAAALLPTGARTPITGKLGFDANLEGTGLSLAALIGSLGGSASFKLEDATVNGLDPKAFDAVTRAVDQGLPLDANRVGDRVETALASGRLGLRSIEGNAAVTAGQFRLSGVSARTDAVEVTVTGGVNLASYALDARVALAPLNVSGTARPEIVVNLKGPIEAPLRTLDVAMFTSWLALRAVEQQAKRLDAIQGARSDAPTPPPAVASTPASPYAVPFLPSPSGAPPPAAFNVLPVLPPPIEIRRKPSVVPAPRADVTSPKEALSR